MTKKAWSDSVPVLFGAALLVVVVLGSGVAWWANRSGANVERAHLLPTGRALVVLRLSSMLGSDHRARVVEVDVETGIATKIVDDAGTWAVDLQVHGPAGGSFWFVSGPTTLWSRPLDAIDRRVDHDLSNHPELAGGFDAQWYTPAALVVHGRAGGEYEIAPDGAITPSDWTLNAMRWMEWRADGRTDLVWKMAVPLADGREANRDALPLESGGFVVRNDGSPVWVDGGRAAVAVGGDLTIPVGYPRNDRIGAVSGDGLVWSVAAGALFGEPEHWDLWLERLSIRVLAVEVSDQRLMLVLHATDNDGGSELRFVTLDGATGRVLLTTSLAPLG